MLLYVTPSEPQTGIPTDRHGKATDWENIASRQRTNIAAFMMPELGLILEASLVYLYTSMVSLLMILINSAIIFNGLRY